MKKLLVCAHYDRDNIVEEYFINNLNILKPHFDYIIVVSTSLLNADELIKLQDVADETLIKKNEGFDFFSWKFALHHLGKEELEQYSEILFTNDSFYIINPMDDIFKEISNSPETLMGLTDHGMAVSHSDNPMFNYHIQSYFLYVKNDAITDFINFVEQLKLVNHIHELVVQGEVDLYPYMAKHGHLMKVLYPQYNTKYDTSSYSLIFNPVKCLKEGLPIVKRKAFSFAIAKFRQDVIKYLKIHTSHKTFQYIEQHLHRILTSNQYLIAFSNLAIARTDHKPKNNLKIAVQIHMYYPNFRTTVYEYLKKIDLEYDLLISVHNQQHKEFLYKYFSEKFPHKNIILKIVENAGRNISALLLGFKDELLTYDVIAHFHSKQSPQFITEQSLSWTEYLLENILSKQAFYSNVKLFNEESNLGVTFPPLYQGIYQLHEVLYGPFKPRLETFLNGLNLKYKPTLPDDHLYVSPWGCFFWFRPKAIEKIINNISYEDFKNNNEWQKETTFAHLLERAFVEVAKCSGYRFKYLLTEDEFINHYLTISHPNS